MTKFIYFCINNTLSLVLYIGMSTFGTGTRATPTEDDEINKESKI